MHVTVGRAHGDEFETHSLHEEALPVLQSWSAPLRPWKLKKGEECAVTRGEKDNSCDVAEYRDTRALRIAVAEHLCPLESSAGSSWATHV